MLIAILVLGIIGVAATKMLMAQTRFYDRETNQRTARSIARSGTTVLLSDLRMVQDSGGVDSVTADGKLIRILVPYRFGLVCATSGNVTTASMLPIDSGTTAYSVYRGFAWRQPTGRYKYVSPDNPLTSDIPVTSTNPASCTGSAAGQAQIRTVTANGRPGEILNFNSPTPSGATVGAPVFFWQRITYSFRTSTVYPNRLGLWRNVEGGRNEELMAPFDTSSRFKFYKSGDEEATVAPPLIGEIRGLDLVLTALSPRGTSNNPRESQARLVTSVFFKNVRAF